MRLITCFQIYQLLNKSSRITAKIPIPVGRRGLSKPEEHEIPERTASAFVTQPLDWTRGDLVPLSSRKQEHLMRGSEPEVWS